MALEEPLAHPSTPADQVGPDYCDVSTATRLLGDRWSLLIVRELFVGNIRFTEMQEALPGLSRSLLASRLGYLTRLGIVERVTFDGGDLRAKHCYALSETGRALGPVLTALGDWAVQWRASTGPVTDGERSMDLTRLRTSLDPSVLPAERMQIQFMLTDGSPAWLRADRTGVRACRGVHEGEVDLVVRSSVTALDDLYWGRRTCREAIARRDISFDGSLAHAQAFSGWFPNRPAIHGVGSDPMDQPDDGEPRTVHF